MNRGKSTNQILFYRYKFLRPQQSAFCDLRSALERVLRIDHNSHELGQGQE